MLNVNMSTASSNATSPSTSSKPTTNLGTNMVRSASNLSIFQSNNRKPVTRSRQNTLGGLDFGDEHVRNIGSDYQEIQIRTLTKWVNAQLKEVGDHIDNIKTDLKDGKRLLKLLSVVSKEPAPKPEKMNMRIHQLANVAQALSFLEKQVGSENMPDIGNEAIVNGDLKKTLALIFFIMMKYQIQLILNEHGEDFIQSLSELSKVENGKTMQSTDFIDASSNAKPVAGSLATSRKFGSHNSISDKLHNSTTSTSLDAKVALLYWVRIQLEDYLTVNIIPPIQDFSRSWRNGVAFCLLIHRHNPAYIPDLFSVYLTMNLAEKSTWLQLLKLAFSLATDKLGIQAYLEPEDLVDVEYPHEPSVMMYVSEYYKIMSKHQREESDSEKKERAAKRKAAIIMASGGIVEPLPENENKPDKLLPPLMEAPVPVPVPSARRRRKMQQRQSSLAEEDKARIKADLNNKLLMQLTGHLPRGVHPTLDELLTIHDTVLSFIRSNTLTIDEMPLEFQSSASVTEYVEAIEIIEEQTMVEESHLETARIAKDTLTTPPEKADDTLIHLTDLQRTQVTKLYDMLQNEWNQFIELLKTTKEDLIQVENTLIDTEERVELYLKHVANMQEALDKYMVDIKQVLPHKNAIDVLHPTEKTNETIGQYQQQLVAILDRFAQFTDTVWKGFNDETQGLPSSVMQLVQHRYTETQEKYNSLKRCFEKEQKECEDFKKGLMIGSKVQSIESELEVIQSIMEDSSEDKKTTNDTIQDLESKVANVKTNLYSLKEEFSDLFSRDNRFAVLLSEIQTKYEIVNTWVDQVRVWFVEAERIRGWIEDRIQIIRQKDTEDSKIDPLSQDVLSQIGHINIDAVVTEHQKLKKEINRFNEDDMARLPDATTIEITLTTLNNLNRLMSLLQTRSKFVGLLGKRLEWESLIERAERWCNDKDTEISNFIQTSACWSKKQDDEEEVSNLQIKQKNEDIIHTLVSHENTIADFDKGEFSKVLDIYQEMEEIEQDTLPSHLEGRQEVLENKFEFVMKKCSFARKIVEQHLVVNDVVSQFKKLKSEGEKIKMLMTHSNSTVTSSGAGQNDQDNGFDERIRQFKESSSYWVTTLLKRIPYPDCNQGHFKEEEEVAKENNRFIQNKMEDYSMYLAEITEDLEMLLTSHRENLSLQQRASLAYDDLLRITSWIEERLKLLLKFDFSILDKEEVINVDHETIDRLEKEHDSIMFKIKHLEERDIKRTLDVVRRLEIEIEETNSTSIDRAALIDGIEHLEEARNELMDILSLRTHQIHALKKRSSWELQWDEAITYMNELAYKLWDFNTKFAEYDIEGLRKRSSSSSIESTQSIVDVMAELEQLKEQVNILQDRYSIVVDETAFNELQEAYTQLIDYTNMAQEEHHLVTVPKCLNNKQLEINKEYEDLKKLTQYVSDITEQNLKVEKWTKSCSEILVQGENILDELQRFVRESNVDKETPNTDGNPDMNLMNDRVDAFKDQIHDLLECFQSVQCFECGNWFTSCQNQSVSESNEYNAQMKVFIDKKMQSLKNLEQGINDILHAYQSIDTIKAKLEEYQEDAHKLQEWIDKSMESLSKRRIESASVSLTGITKDTVSTCRIENQNHLKELNDFDDKEVQHFQKNIEDLITTASNNSSPLITQVIDACKALSDSIVRGISTLRQSITSETLALDATSYRLIWEEGLAIGQAQLDKINGQLQDYVSKKNKCVARQEELTDESVQSLYDELQKVEAQYKVSKEESLNAIEKQYEDVKSSFLKLPLVNSVPGHIHERMEAFQRSFEKMEEAISHRQKELYYIQQRAKLESDIKSAMLSLEQQTKAASLFVEVHARWNPNETENIRVDDIVDVEAEWLKKKNEFQQYRQTTLVSIKQAYKDLQTASAASKPGFMSELHVKKMEALNQSEDYMDAEINYAQDLITLRKQLSEFLDKESQLEQTADMIREEILSQASMGPPENELMNRLEAFKEQVKAATDFAKLKILIPKRHNEEDVPMTVKVKDRTMNSVVQDVISTKINRLDEFVESLSSLIKSHEVFTRLQYILRTFRKQMAACEKWIQTRKDILEKNVHMLDDENLALDLNCLRDAVSEADSIQTAMKAYDNNFTLLCKYREKYISVFEEQVLLSEEEREERLTEYEEVGKTFERISHMWQDLLLETAEVSNALSNALLPAELNGRIAILMDSLEALKQEIDAVDQASVTDEQVNQWQRRIDHLEAREYDRLHSEVHEHERSINVDIMESLKAKLDTAGDTIFEIRATLASLYDIINAIRLQNTHAENAKAFQTSSSRACVLLESTKKLGCVVEKASEAERVQQLRSLIIIQKQVKEAISECSGLYDDSCSYYTGLKIQDLLTPQAELMQKEIEESFEKIQAESVELSSLITRTSKWIEACDGLDKLRKVLNNIKNEVERFIVNGIPSTTSSNKIRRFEKQLLQVAMNQDDLENNVNSTEDIVTDEVNKVPFFKQSQDIRALNNFIQLALDKRRAEKERTMLFEAFNNEIAKVSKICEDQITYIRQQSSTNPEHHLKKSDAIKSVVNAYTAALSHIEDNYHDCKSKYDGIISDQASKLIRIYQQPASDVENAKKNLERLLKELDVLLQTENDYITTLKLLKKLISLDKEITRSINDLKTGASRSYGVNKGVLLKTTISSNSRSKEIPELRSFMQRYESTEGSVKLFYKRCDELRKTLNRRASTARINAIIKAIDRRKEDMGRKWNEIKTSADETRTRLDLLHKYQTVNIKLAESLRYVEDLKERVEALQLSGKSVSVEEQELEELQEEIDGTLKKNVNDIDTLLKSIRLNQLSSSISETSLKAQRDKLVGSIENLRQLVIERQEQAHTEGSITKFFGITNQIDTEILRLSKVIEETSTQHASLIGSKFNKSDLQALLKTLVTAYRSSEPVVIELLDQAKSEARKQFLDDNDRVANAIKKTMKEWSSIQVSVASREKELQTCIKELDHEFFTKLAMARTSPRERRARGSSHSGATLAPPSRPAGSFRSSTLSTELKMASTNNANIRRSQSPSMSGGRRGSTYVADPKNELDVQLGRIINDSPYKMKVKRVQGEVGKYWFGDEHPRLVYCRILPSKMVMVRVGGGWVELSRYMKDHGHTENTTKPDSSETPALKTQKETINNTTLVEPTEISPQDSGTLTDKSSNSSTGYLEEERYIKLKEDGNQISFKLTKAEEDTVPAFGNSKKEAIK
ncbi:Spectrin beta chain, non-erythrocytic 1 [Rhizopus azygosporus]|uniref:Spectrin beta chain, non-erythrocytic 1 n=1 Tax=Rhizopus azygosporus TaxID=86630 RepID=A0A367K9G4_RHIAZ|nr:Spectrin beta chain, non-erythrocytic 1 [Rhizopus azygosporus]